MWLVCAAIAAAPAWVAWRLGRWDRAEEQRKEQLRQRLLSHADATRRLCDDIEEMLG